MVHYAHIKSFLRRYCVERLEPTICRNSRKTMEALRMKDYASPVGSLPWKMLKRVWGRDHGQKSGRGICELGQESNSIRGTWVGFLGAKEECVRGNP